MVVESILASGGPFLITFRESLEAALIVAIVAAYLVKTNRQHLNKYLWIGTILAIVTSIAIGIILAVIYGGLEGTAEQVFEGTSGILAAIVLTYMIFWMARHSREIKEHLQKKVDIAVSKGYLLGLAAVSFVAVVREGIETVLFLTATAVQDTLATLIGAAAGILIVLVLAMFTMKRIYNIDLNKFFKYSSIVLVIFAAGLLGFGIHEFIEVGEGLGVDFGFWGQNAFDINPILDEKGIIGSILKGLVGYDGNPEILRVFGYIAYWIVIGIYLMVAYYPDHKISRIFKKGDKL